jgi:glycosyltransferase involved in cell wall biosynthesis
MRILFITQVIDRNDPYLSFVHRWIAAFSREFESITAICLKKGDYDLPKNVKVLSLGKEKKKGKVSPRLSYVFVLYRCLWRERGSYDAVFVHMNQEYMLVAGWWWKLTGKPAYMWRNHYAGSILTDMAAAFCTNVFCTSKYSHTANYERTIFMPVGVDTAFFRPVAGVARAPRSILFFARMAPSKRPDALVEALGILAKKGIDFSASFVGDAIPKDAGYHESLKSRALALGLDGKISWESGVPNDRTPAIYSAHEIFINLSPSGMLDKTIFEAMACGTIALASSEDLKGKVSDGFIFKDASPDEIAAKIEAALALDPSERAKAVADMRALAESQSLEALVKRLREAMDQH